MNTSEVELDAKLEVFNRKPSLTPRPPDKTDYEGTELYVSWGKEHVQPCRFQGMDIGPYGMTVKIQEGETPLVAKRRALAQMQLMAEEEYRTKLPRFIRRCKEVADLV